MAVPGGHGPPFACGRRSRCPLSVQHPGYPSLRRVTGTSPTSLAAAERAANPELYPEGVVAGHGPDTTWTGNPDPFRWLPLDQSVNASLGAQAQHYPLGYRPTGFWFIDDFLAEFGVQPGG